MGLLCVKSFYTRWRQFLESLGGENGVLEVVGKEDVSLDGRGWCEKLDDGRKLMIFLSPKNFILINSIFVFDT